MDSTVNRVSGSPAVSAAAGVETAIAAAPATARPATAAAARTVQSSTGEPDRPRTAEKAAQIFGAREFSSNTLKVSVDKQAGVIVRIVDASGNVIRQVPPEELVALAKRLDDAIGLLFDKKA